MKILAVTHAVPSRAITNAWVLEQLRLNNGSRFSAAELDLLERRVARFFEGTGTQVRYALNAGERAIDFTLEAGRRALAASGVSAQEVDFLIYVGVGRGWTEPAVANVVQAGLGLAGATCFDVVDACASWLRAIHIAQAYIRCGMYRCGLIVNCECAFVTYKNWQLQSVDDVEHRAAGWTVGEAATATIVTSDDSDDDFYFTFRNFGEHYDLCMFPLPMASDYTTRPLDPRCVPMTFFALSRPLLTVTIEKLMETFKADSHLGTQRYDIVFGHEASTKASLLVTKRLGLSDRYYGTHARFGNTASASVPLGISLALEEGKLRRGQKVLVLVGSSGITVGIGSFTF